jgi:hypothetical protein
MLEFIETPVYTATVDEYLDGEEQAALQWFLVQDPEAGAVVRGSGGLRKLRWRRTGTGKRGGVRVIYYFRTRAEQIWLVMIYAKSGRETVPAHVLRALKKELIDVETE